MKGGKTKKEKLIIGRKEKIDIPGWGLKNLDAKVDTGAYSCSLHCKILGEKHIDGIPHIRFIPLAKKYKARNAQEITAPISNRKKVKSSSGHIEERYFIKIAIQIGPEIFETEFSLSNRTSMRYTILLGRRLLKKRFLVDPARSYIFYKQAKKSNIAKNTSV